MPTSGQLLLIWPDAIRLISTSKIFFWMLASRVARTLYHSVNESFRYQSGTISVDFVCISHSAEI
jgi:hypothetical protein